MAATVLRIVSGSANPGLAGAVANHLGVESDGCTLERYPDGELRPMVENVCGADIYVVQPTAPPVNDHLVELLLLLDACRRARAARVTAVMPYFGYARQDRRTAAGQALGSRVVADAIAAAGADRLVVVDPHTPGLEVSNPGRNTYRRSHPVRRARCRAAGGIRGRRARPGRGQTGRTVCRSPS